MTDHPRFQLIDGERDERHRHYHGAGAVDLVLRLADWWLSLPGQQHLGRRCDPLRAFGLVHPSPSTVAQSLSELSRGSAERQPHGERE